MEAPNSSSTKGDCQAKGWTECWTMRCDAAGSAVLVGRESSAKPLENAIMIHDKALRAVDDIRKGSLDRNQRIGLDRSQNTNDDGDEGGSAAVGLRSGLSR